MRDMARERVAAAIKELGELEFEVGVASANQTQAEFALDSLKPHGRCTVLGCWDFSAMGAMGRCEAHKVSATIAA